MTVEAAIALGALVAMLAFVLAAVAALVLQVRCVDAAGEAARLAARDDEAGARRAVAGLLSPDAEVTFTARADDVVVRIRVPPLGGALPGLRVSAQAVAAREPQVAGPTPGDDGDGAVADGAVADGAVADGAVADGAVADGAATEGGAP